MTPALVRFGDVLAEPLRNGVYKPKQYHGRGAKVINMKELFGFERIDDQATDRVDLEPKELARAAVRPGDLLFARRSFVLEGAGKCSIIGTPSEATTFESSMIRARLDADRAIPQFMYYLFASPLGRAAMASIATRTAVSGITGMSLQELMLPIPLLGLQRKIVAILAGYDELVENNHRRIALLEEMAQRIYREWFVDHRYPGHEDVPLIDSEQGLIPAGWSVSPLIDLADIIMGQSPPSSAYNTERRGLPFHQGVGSYGERFPVHNVYSTSGDRTATDGDILVSVRAPVGRINISDREMILGRGLSAVRGRAAPQDFVLHALMQFFRQEDVIGGGSIFNSVTKRDLQGVPIIWPGIDLADTFSALVRPIWSEIRVLTIAMANLRGARDLLLPRLISGAIDVTSLSVAMPEVAA